MPKEVKYKDPSKLPVQWNIMVPWDFRQFIRAKSQHDGITQNDLALNALMEAYGREFVHEQTRDVT